MATPAAALPSSLPLSEGSNVLKANQPLTVSLYGYRYHIQSKVNANAKNSALIQFKDFVGSAYGAYKMTDLCSKICREGVEISRFAKNHSAATTLQGPGAVFSRVSGSFILPYTAYAAIEMKEAVDKVARKGGSYGNIEKLVQSVLTFVASSCYSLIQFIPGQAVLKSIATVADLLSEGVELKQEATEWSKVDDLQNDDKTVDLQVELAQKKTQHLLGLIKSVISVVAGIFAFLTMVFTTAVVPPLVSATIGLFATFLTVCKHFHAENIEKQLLISR